MDFQKVIFKNKTFSSVLEEIYSNSRDKEKQISKLIDDLKPMIKGPGDAVIMVPLLQEYLALGIKNDDQLVKMAAIIQRAMQEKDEQGDFILDEKAREELYKLASTPSLTLPDHKVEPNNN